MSDQTQMRGRRLSDDYASLIFKYCNENPDFTIKQLTNLVEKSKSTVYDVLTKKNIKELFSTKKNRLGCPRIKNRSEDDQFIRKLETNRRKT